MNKLHCDTSVLLQLLKYAPTIITGTYITHNNKERNIRSRNAHVLVNKSVRLRPLFILLSTTKSGIKISTDVSLLQEKDFSVIHSAANNRNVAKLLTEKQACGAFLIEQAYDNCFRRKHSRLFYSNTV